MKKLVITVAAIAAAALAPVAGAATLHVVSGSPTSQQADGFAVAADDGWRLSNCWGTGFWDAAGIPVGPLSPLPTNPPELHTTEIQGDGEVAVLAWGTWSPTTAHVRVACDAYKTETRVTYSLRWRWFTKVRSGPNTSTRSRSSSCYIDNWFGDLHLDCWGGRYASATWRFSLPRDARRISRAIIGEPGCCSSGTMGRTWSGNTATVRVTNWRSYYVDRVRIRYQHRVKVRTVTTVGLTARLTATF